MSNSTPRNYTTLRAAIKAEIKEDVAEWIQIKRNSTTFDQYSYRALRAKHIAYSLLRGRTFEQIESKHRDPKAWINISVKAAAEKLLASWLQEIKAASALTEVANG